MTSSCFRSQEEDKIDFSKISLKDAKYSICLNLCIVFDITFYSFFHFIIRYVITSNNDLTKLAS